MSLIIWMDFWDWDGSALSLTAVPMQLSTITTGGARGRSPPNNTYPMLPDEYWEAREARLVEDQPKSNPAVPQEKQDAAPAPPPMPDTQRAGLLDQMRNASSLDEMKNISAQLRG